MSEVERIRRMIREGRIDEREGEELLTAFHAAEARDRLARAAIESRRARRSRRGPTIAAALVLLVLGAIAAAVVLGPGGGEGDGVRDADLGRLESMDPGDAIATMEERLRRPGTATDYRALARAYERRYEQTDSPEDLARATRAAARAERIERRDDMRGSLVFPLVGAVLVIGGIALWLMLLYNGLAKRDERVDERWAQVEAELQRRLDLVPVLVETVRGYAGHERETLLAVTEARARAAGTLRAVGEARQGGDPAALVEESQAELEAGLRRLLAVVERYPDLKASRNFLALQDQLEGTENRIAVERQRYNDAVRAYNQSLRTFPSNVVGSAFGFATREYFESQLGAEEPPPVEFETTS